MNDESYFAKYIELAARKAAQEENSSVLILLDSEDFCPAVLGPSLLQKAKSCRSDVRIEVLLAYREFETWFLAAAQSLRGKCGLPCDLQPPGNPESIRGAKEWIERKMGSSYIETEHQPRLASVFDMSSAKSIASFARGFQKLEEILR